MPAEPVRPGGPGGHVFEGLSSGERPDQVRTTDSPGEESPARKRGTCPNVDPPQPAPDKRVVTDRVSTSGQAPSTILKKSGKTRIFRVSWPGTRALQSYGHPDGQ